MIRVWFIYRMTTFALLSPFFSLTMKRIACFLAFAAVILPGCDQSLQFHTEPQQVTIRSEEGMFAVGTETADGFTSSLCGNALIRKRYYSSFTTAVPPVGGVYISVRGVDSITVEYKQGEKKLPPPLWIKQKSSSLSIQTADCK